MAEKKKISIDEVYEDTGVDSDFPKYTTQLLNLANQNAQGTRPEVVGQMSDLIGESDADTFEEWKEWYLGRHPDAVDRATERIKEHVENLSDALDKIDEAMIRSWVKDLVLVKTAEGLLIEEKIFDYLSKRFDRSHRDSSAEEESKGIDGYIGSVPVSVKPESYSSKSTTKHEEISAAMVTYKTTRKYLTINFEESDFR